MLNFDQMAMYCKYSPILDMTTATFVAVTQWAARYLCVVT